MVVRIGQSDLLLASIACDPSSILSAIGITPDPWQIDFARSTAKRRHVKVHRQGGKSTTVAGCAVGKAVLIPESLIIIGSPSQRQSIELFRKVRSIFKQVRRRVGLRDAQVTEKPIKHRFKEDPLDIQQESAMQMELGNGSRIVALPDNPDAVVGYSAARLVIIDEAARTSDEFNEAVRPMLAVSDGDLWAISTPKGRRGFFWETSEEANTPRGVEYAHWNVPIVEPHVRIKPSFLAGERALGQRYWDQEWLCKFVESEGAVFSEESIADAVSDDVAPAPWVVAAGGR